jgi:phosphoribosyl 1,2-cyclic phosphodiesterase
MGLSVRFWGVRGTFPCAQASHLGYGGNTSCVEAEADGQVILLDAGTGLRQAGKRLLQRGIRKATLLLSHAHWDHINGFPFFEPAYRADFSLRIISRDLAGCDCVGQVLRNCMQNPLFPVPLNAMRADLSFHRLTPGQSLQLAPDLNIESAELNHPGGAAGYRIAHGGRSFCYVTDTEHRPGETDEQVLRLMRGVDLALYDSTYSEAEFASKRGWGHSTWNEGARLARLAGVRHFGLFHHDPDHDDTIMAALEAEAQAHSPGSFAAREGMQIDLDDPLTLPRPRTLSEEK